MKISKIIVLLFLLFSISCKQKVRINNDSSIPLQSFAILEQNSEIHIDPRTFEKNELQLTSFAEDIEYIPLSNKVLIDKIVKLYVNDKAIYVVSDKAQGGEGNGLKTLFRFDIDGKNPKQIGATGRGSQEYLSSEYFTVDEINNRIYINGRPNTILVYNTNGDFIRDFKFNNHSPSYAQISLLGNDYLLFAMKKLGAKCEHLWSISDTLGNNLFLKENTTPAFKTNIGPLGEIYKFGDKITYWVDYNDTLFTIYPDLTFKASAIISSGDHKWSPKNIEIRSMKDYLKKVGNLYYPHYFIQTTRYIISRYTYFGKSSYVLLDKRSKSSYTCDFEWNSELNEGIPNNFDCGLNFFPINYFTNMRAEYLVGTINAYIIKKHISTPEFESSKTNYPPKKKAFHQLANRLNENDNPVLMLVKLKE